MVVDPDLDRRVRQALAGPQALQAVLELTKQHLRCDSGTLHWLAQDGMLHLQAATAGIPEPVLAVIRTIPVGKGMAGLAVERREPVLACNLQTDTTGDVRPGAKTTGLQGAIVVPCMQGDQAVGALGVANRGERVFTAAEIEVLLQIGRTIAATR